MSVNKQQKQLIFKPLTKRIRLCWKKKLMVDLKRKRILFLNIEFRFFLLKIALNFKKIFLTCFDIFKCRLCSQLCMLTIESFYKKKLEFVPLTFFNCFFFHDFLPLICVNLPSASYMLIFRNNKNFLFYILPKYSKPPDGILNIPENI